MGPNILAGTRRVKLFSINLGNPPASFNQI